MRVAAVDIGSNSIHMVIAEVEADGRFRVLDRAKDMVRLGGRAHNEGALSDGVMDAGIATLTKLKTLAERNDVTRVQAVATSAVREAANGGDFINRVKEEVGWRIKVIQGLEEARLIYLGVRHAMDLSGKTPSLIVDIGGGSVELIVVESGEPVFMDSLKLGVARLTDRYLKKDPPRDKELDALAEAIESELGPFKKFLARSSQSAIEQVIGTSGTMLNLIAMAAHRAGNEPGGKHPWHVTNASDLRRLRKKIVRSDRGERATIKKLDSKRVDLIVAGASVADAIVDATGCKSVVACTWALREGVLLDFINRHQPGIAEVERYDNPRIRSVVRLARHLGETSKHGEQVASLALQIFDQLAGKLDLTPESREWLHYAALLHDIGHHIEHKNHHRHAHYLISNGELLGFKREEIEVIALVARYHRKAMPKESDSEFASIGDNLKPLVRKLSTLLRIADSLDRSHFGVVKQIKTKWEKKRLTFTLDTGDADAALEIWDAEQRSKPLRQEIERDIVFNVATAP